MEAKYNILIHWFVTDVCNLDCKYCFRDRTRTTNLRIDVPNLIKTLDGTGKIFRINFAGGGEPFSVPNMVEACQEITKNHYISLNTNLTSPRIKEFCGKVDPKKVSYIVASCHIKELKRTKLMEGYIENFHLCQEKGFNVEALAVGHPEILKEATTHINFFKKNGIKLSFTHFIGKYEGKEYPNSYTHNELKIVNDGAHVSMESHSPFGKKCNAGYNVAIAQVDGAVHTCSHIPEILGSLYSGITFNKNIITCPKKHCNCPLNAMNDYLFRNALQETRPIQTYFSEKIEMVKNVVLKF